MSTSVTEAEMNETDIPEDDYDPSIPDVSLLTDKFPDWFKLPPISAGFTFLLGVTFFFFDRLRPIWHTDVWGHLSYGRHIWENGAIPATEPLMPLSLGVAFVDSAWLTQVLGYGAFLLVGKAAVTFLFAAALVTALGVLTRRVYTKTNSATFTTVAFGLMMWVNFQQFTIPRPQIIGFLFFCLTFSMLLKREWSPKNWVLVPVMFALWANMHGSFIVGLGLMSCFVAGRAIDLLRRTGKVGILFRDNRLRRLLLLTEVSAIATLLNPYGLTLYSEVLSFSNNPNLQSIIEWQALHIRMSQGQAAGFVALMLCIIYRISPRRVSTAEVLSLAIFGAAALWTSRMIMWWAPLAGCFAAIHAAAAWRQWRRAEVAPEPSERASIWTVVSLGLAFIFFELSHLGGVSIAVATGKPLEQLNERIPVSKLTPVAATEYLNKNPPEGLVFCTYEWGDYLMWKGPKNMQVFVASHCHLVPEEVWNDYMGIIRMNSGWEAMLKRYGINTVIVDQEMRESMVRRLRESNEWKLNFLMDGQAILERVDPIEL